MAEQHSSTNKTRPKQRPAKGPKKANESLLSLFLFAIGLGAVLAVLYLGYVHYFQSGAGGDIDDLDRLNASSITAQDQRRINRYDVDNVDARIPTLRDITGKWQTGFEDKRAYVTFYGDEFQMLYIDSPQRSARAYSAGRFEYDAKTGLIRLIPNRDATNALKGDVVTNSLITMRQFDFRLIYDRANNALVWQVPDKQTRIHPIFFYLRKEDNGIIGWMRAQR